MTKQIFLVLNIFNLIIILCNPQELRIYHIKLVGLAT
jgi:hypothetical protein